MIIEYASIISSYFPKKYFRSETKIFQKIKSAILSVTIFDRVTIK